jgi:catechol-2,3-dioxygenase
MTEALQKPTMNILEIQILTDRLAETELFYSQVLELKILRKSENLISFKTGQSSLTFISSNRIHPIYHFAFTIPCDKLEEAIIWIASKIDLIKNEKNEVVTDFKNWNAKSVYFFDNNGNILEFIARFSLNNTSAKPFSSTSIESISEIGIVTDTPLKLADTLVEENNLSYFSRGPKSEKFAVLGDDNGLFIISKINRKWYPTKEKSRSFYSKIIFSTDGKTNQTITTEGDAEE